MSTMSPPLDARVLHHSRRRLLLSGVVVVCEVTSALFLALCGLEIGDILQKVVLTKEPLGAIRSVVFFGILFLMRLGVVQIANLFALKVGADLADQYRSTLVQYSKDNVVAESELGYLSTDGANSLIGYVQRLLPVLVGSITVTPLLLLFVLSQGLLYFVELLIGLGVLPVLMVVIGRATRDKAVEKLDVTIRLNSLYLDTLKGIGTLKSFNKAKVQITSISKAATELKRSTLSVLQIAFASGVALDTLVSIVVAVVAVSIGIRLNDGGLTLRAGAAILFVTPEIFAPIRGAALQFHASQDAVAVLDRIDSIVNKDKELFTGVCFEDARTDSEVHFEFDDLEFRDFGVVVVERSIALQLSVVVERGRWLAVTGESGSGKSSLLRALVGESDFVGEIVVRSEDGAFPLLLSQIAYMPAVPGFFDASLWDNLALYESSASKKQIYEALEFVGLSDLKDRLTQIVVPGGANFSSGERQRLAIARTIVSKRPVWVFDEPTAHLNPQLEDEILRGLKSLSREKIVIVATHSKLAASLSEHVAEVSEGRCRLLK